MIYGADTPTNAYQHFQTRWWQRDPSLPEEIDATERATALVSETAAIEMRQSTWHETNLWNASLFANRELVGFRWGTIEAHGELIPKDLRTENLIEEIGESLLAKASSSPLIPTPTPHGDDYEVEQAVRKLQCFIHGTWRHVRAENAAVEAFLDSFLAGLGCVRVGWDKVTKTVLAETVFFDNIIVDNRECSNRSMPRHYRIRQVMPRSVVEARYGVNLGKQGKYVDYRQVGEGWVVLVEAFRLPDADGNGGWHMVSSCGQALVDEPWKHPWVPLAFFHWRDPVSGFFPRSGVELLVPYQMRINQLNDAIEESQDIACRPRILLHGGTNIDVNQWDNEAGRMLGYTGIEPKPFNWPTQLMELYNERERVRETAHAYMGLSLMSSQADIPQQVRMDSSQGIREFRNMEDARHLRMWTRFEQFRLEIAKLILNVLAAGEGSESFMSTYHPSGGRASVTVPYSEIKTLTQDHYSWSMDSMPLSMMTPAVRRETIRDFTSRGLVDSNEARRMEGNPNLERIEDLEMASYDDILRHLELLEKGEYEAPTKLTNLTYGIPRVTQNFHRLKTMKKIHKNTLVLHQQWIATAVAIQQAGVMAAQAQQAAAAAPFAPTQGVPGTQAANPGAQ